jgi:hypothetical protein
MKVSPKQYETLRHTSEEHRGAQPWNGHTWEFRPVNGAPNLTFSPTMVKR